MSKQGFLTHFDADVFTDALEEQGFTNTAFGKKIGMHSSAVGTWKSGEGKPSIKALKKLAKALKMHPGELSVDFTKKSSPKANGDSSFNALQKEIAQCKVSVNKELFDNVTEPKEGAKLAEAMAHLNRARDALN